MRRWGTPQYFFLAFIDELEKKKLLTLKPLKRQSHKMVKHTQTIRQLPMNCLGVYDHFVKLTLQGLRKLLKWANKKQNNFNIYNAAYFF